MAFLRFDRERGDRPCLKSLDRDRLAGFLAIAVGALIEALQRGSDLGGQLALPIAGAQLDRAVGFGGRAIREIGMIVVLALQMLQGFLGFFQDVLAPGAQPFAEIVPLALIHEGLFVGWTILVLLFPLRQ